MKFVDIPNSSEVTFGYYELPVTDEDIQICETIIEEYEELEERPKDVWVGGLVDSYQSTMISLIYDKDARKLAEILRNIGRTEVARGFYASKELHEKVQVSGKGLTENFRNVLLDIATAMGLLPVRTEKYNLNRIKTYDVIRDMESELGFSIVIPNTLGGVPGIKWGEGVIFPRHLFALYAATLLSKKIRNGDSIWEIGAGLGAVPYYLNQFFPVKYAITDLPSTNVVQKFFLRKSNIAAHIVPIASYQKDIRSVDITLNQNSMPEMHRSIMKDYLEHINNHSRMFYSINDDRPGRPRVPDLAKEVGLHRVSRHLSWTWKHLPFAEEFYVSKKEAERLRGLGVLV